MFKTEINSCYSLTFAEHLVIGISYEKLNPIKLIHKGTPYKLTREKIEKKLAYLAACSKFY